MKILVADDDYATREGLAKVFRNEGYHVITAESGLEALDLFDREKPDLLCLDIMMPGKDGYEVCKQIRRRDEVVPILFISAKGEEIDKVLGMELGGDDFIVKPFGVRELIARIRSITRRCLAAGKNRKEPENGKSSGSPFSMGSIEVFPSELRARRKEERYDLSLREVSLLELFFHNPGKVLTRVFIAEKCWGYEIVPTSRTVDQHISLLRKKIEPDPENPEIITTVHGTGYRYDLKK